MEALLAVMFGYGIALILYALVKTPAPEEPPPSTSTGLNLLLEDVGL